MSLSSFDEGRTMTDPQKTWPPEPGKHPNAAFLKGVEFRNYGPVTEAIVVFQEQINRPVSKKEDNNLIVSPGRLVIGPRLAFASDHSYQRTTVIIGIARCLPEDDHETRVGRKVAVWDALERFTPDHRIR